MIEDEPAEPTAFDSVVGRVETELSRGRPSGAVEAPPPTVSTSQVRRDQHRSYLTGVAIGVAGFAAAAQLWFASELSTGDQLYAGILGMSKLDAVFNTGVWRWGSALLLAFLALTAHLLAGRGRRWPAMMAAVIGIAIVGLTVHAYKHRSYEASQLIKLEPEPGPAPPAAGN